MPVRFSPEAEHRLQQIQWSYPELRELIKEVLNQDPRPAFHRDDPERRYALRLYDLDVHWLVVNGTCVVERLEKA
nr:hypothetical protein [Halomonas utahensis]